MATESKDRALERIAVNPWPWSLAVGFNQAEIVTGQTRTLYCAGQVAVDGEGAAQHPGDMAAQLDLAADNLETVLAAAGMCLADVVRLTIYTTDVDLFFSHYGVLASRLAAAGVAPPATLVGVARLAYLTLMVELEATAVR
jgi:enamine deaminase RidA (YjgF/YER057c/UK114 family)